MWDCEARNGTSGSSLSSSIKNLGGMLKDERGECAMLAAVVTGFSTWVEWQVVVKVAFAAAMPHRRVMCVRAVDYTL